MRTAYKYQTNRKKSYAERRKAREKFQSGKKTCCMSTNLLITALKTKNWGSLELREENATAPQRDLMAATSFAVGVGTTPTLSGTWRGVNVSLSGAATCAAGGVRPWLTYTPASKIKYRKYGQTILHCLVQHISAEAATALTMWDLRGMGIAKQQVGQTSSVWKSSWLNSSLPCRNSSTNKNKLVLTHLNV